MAATYAVIKKTQDQLGKYVQKPPLTEKLLSKPPFRFLHDVVSAVINSQGVFSGLYDSEEMVSGNVKDKDSKIRYLEKLLDALSWALGGPPLAAKPSKIVSGQEPGKTNEMLQALAKVVQRKIDTGNAVERVLNGEKPGQKPRSSSSNRGEAGSANQTSNHGENKENNNNVEQHSEKQSRSNSNSRRGSVVSNGRDRSTSRGRSSQPSSDSSRKGGGGGHRSSRSSEKQTEELKSIQEMNGQNGDTAEHNGGDNPETSLQTLQRQSEASTANGHPESIDGPESLQGQPMENESALAGSPRSHRSNGSSGQQDRPTTSYKKRTSASAHQSDHAKQAPPSNPDEGGVTVLGEGSTMQASEESSQQQRKSARPTPSRARPGSAIKSARPRAVPPTPGGRQRSARPPSARPAAPRLKDKAEPAALEEEPTRPQTGKVANVILASDDKDGGLKVDDDDDAEAYLVEEAPKDNLSLELEATAAAASVPASTSGAEGGHGALVQEILDTQKQLDAEHTKRIGGTGPVEIERDDGLTEIGRRRDRESTQREVDKLRSSIQTLTRSANPLGKLMDYLQEDVDSMQRELDTWREENDRLSMALKEEEATTEKSVQPLKLHLQELDSAIQEQLDRISTVKCNILKNEEKISRMIGSVGMPAFGK